MGTVSYHLDLPIYQEALRDHIVERCRDAPKHLETSEFGVLDEHDIKEYIAMRCNALSLDDVKWVGLLQLAWATDDVVTTVG